jgi:hypothetical protein
MYAASMVGRQEDYNDAIIRDVWAEEEYEGMNLTKATDICQSLKNTHGAEAWNKCKDAAVGCKNDSACDTVAEKYAKALSRGYKGSFSDFKRRSENLAAAGMIGMDLVSSLLSRIGSGRDNTGGGDYGGGYDYDPTPKPRTGLYIALGLVAVAGIGAAIYFAKKK